MPAGQEVVTVERATMHQVGPGAAQTPALRVRLERALGVAGLRPPGMPVGAVLRVRRLQAPAVLLAGRGPQPGGWGIGTQQAPWSAGGGGDPGPSPGADLRAQLAALYHAAARPARGPVPPGAPSVLFADAGEELACLTRDLLAGRAAQRWYWQPVLRGRPAVPARALAATWRAEARALPAALALLDRREAQAALALLTPGEVSGIVRALHASHGVPATVFDVVVPDRGSQGDPPLALAPSSGPPSGAAPTAGPAVTTGAPLASEIAAAPWHPWLADSPASPLAPQTQYLLGLGLALHHAPAFARSPAFARQAAAWLQTSLIAPAGRLPTAHTAASRASTPGLPGSGGPVHQVPSAVTAPTGTPAGARAVAGDPGVRHAGAPVLPADAGLGDLPPAVRAADSAGDPPASSVAAAPELGPPAVHTPALHDLQVSAAQSVLASGVATGLGGALYLVHVLAWLDLPHGWDDDGALAAYLGGWGVVEALARGLLGPAHAAATGDPLWAALAALSGRTPGASLGAGLPRADAFRLPAAWLRRLGPPAPLLNSEADGGRLQLGAPAGYLVADIPLAGRAAAAAADSEVATYRLAGLTADWQPGAVPRPEALDPSLAAMLGPGTAWWLARVLGYVRALLARALGLPDPAGLAATLLRRPGRLLAGRTHVDLTLPLDAISLPVRRAGLDRDPGWMPDLGRIVLFHFE